MKRIFILLIAVFISSSAYTQTTIKGIARNAAGKTIRVVGFSDLFSFQRLILASTRINNDGEFTLTVDTDEPRFCILTIDYQQKELYLVPGNTYTVEVKYDIKAPLLSITNPPDFDYEFVNINDDDLNILIRKFNTMYNDFVIERYNELYQARERAMVDTLRNLIDKNFPIIEDPYFKAYIDYKMAMIELSTRYKSGKTIVQEYFIKKPILYNNIEYTDLFKTYFYKYFITNSKDVSFDEILTNINEVGEYKSLLKLLGKDSLLMFDMRILDLVMIDNLRDIYSESGIKKENVIRILRQAANQSYFEGNRDYASNLVPYLQRLKIGTRAPAFTLPDFDTSMVSLVDFLGKKIFLNFWSSDCIPCIEELDSIAANLKKQDTEIAFISISTDYDKLKAEQLIKNKGYNWTLLYYDDNIDVLEKYDVRSNYINYLIDENLNIMRTPGRYAEESLKAVINWVEGKTETRGGMR